MKALTLSQLRRNQRGSILAISLGLIMLASISTLLMSKTLLENQQLQSRRRELSRAFYAAEAGASQVMHWVNFPGDYSDPNLFAHVEDAEGNVYFRNLDAIMNYTVSEDELPVLTSENQNIVSRVKSINLLAPEAGDPVPCLFKIVSVGQSAKISRIGAVEDAQYGAERTVVYYIEAQPLADFTIMAALVSFNTAGIGGTFDVHWGEAWSKTPFDIKVNPRNLDWINASSNNYDPYAIYRTEANFTYSNNWDIYTGGAQYRDFDIYDTTADHPGLFPDGSGDYADAFVQNIPQDTLEWPDFATNYEAFKQLARTNGRYYTTDARGNIYRGSVQNDDTQIDSFTDEFQLAEPGGDTADFVFIDTIDGNEPRADASNLANIDISGSTNGLKGVYYVCANVKKTGAGQPPRREMTSPDGDSLTENVWLDGVFYMAGEADFAGNPVVYGSLIAQLGFVGTGTPTLYYNVELANGIPFGFLSPIRVALWDNY